MSKFAILSVFVLLYAHLPGGLASPTILDRPPSLGDSPPSLGASFSVLWRISKLPPPQSLGGVTSVVGGVTSVVLAVETAVPVPASAVPHARQDLVTSVVGGLTSIVGGVLGAPAPSRPVAL
ncbi:uncharacterized protein ARMOST_04110 [Armillaria ostoyae]|uniref:Uncharacterized protein n=1 Tax=Armillaria ostoyae TaxID=47428 RepID=A0A284QWE6_ARMOS|nr:uncharacterized protein ARMOST_04110 [Armillaria ostoyae]